MKPNYYRTRTLNIVYYKCVSKFNTLHPHTGPDSKKVENVEHYKANKQGVAGEGGATEETQHGKSIARVKVL